ncbi:HNH endonuclease [Labedella endophytica]|uniref:HNH endonuclease n=2 Tax=Labedella endophytica TaxID=1523160 RepID=A0A433JPN0_9MICO|nr:HNH endonuclease [Labedella endophytica]
MAGRKRSTARGGAIATTVVALILLAAYAFSGPLIGTGGDGATRHERSPTGTATPTSAPPIAHDLAPSAASQVLVDAGLIDPVASGLGAGDTAWRVDVPAVEALLASRPVDDRGTPLRYDRDAFGQRWADVDRNGCDQRNDVLARDLVQLTLREGNSCVVVAGVLQDVYTDTNIIFERGQDTSAEVQIDHVVPLAWAWQHGASGWSEIERQQFANDLANLLAVDGRTNSSKSSSGPGEWLPPAADHSCEYVTRWVFVLDRYGLAVGTDDRAVIEDTLDRC